MKVSLVRPNVLVSLGLPAVETFDLTPRQLMAWNRRSAQGLPGPAARRWLQSLAESRLNPSAPLSWADVRAALE